MSRGGASAGTTRLAMPYFAKVKNLTPNATYKFINQMALATDTGSGAGNPLFLSHTDSAHYFTQPSLANTNSGTFTTDANGEYAGWFAIVPTGNARFGTQHPVIPTITLNDGNGGTVATKRLALDMNIQTLAFDNALTDTTGTGIWGNSLATAKNFVVLYDNTNGSGRPISTAIVEALGLRTPISGVPSWLTANVVGTAGAWGTVIPNSLTGILRISQYDFSGAEVAFNTSTDGKWGSVTTVNPNGGNSTPVVITSAVAPLNGPTAVSTSFPRVRNLTILSESGELTLTSLNATQIRICSLTGQTIARATLAKSKPTPISTYSWQPGIYIVVDEHAGVAYRALVR